MFLAAASLHGQPTLHRPDFKQYRVPIYTGAPRAPKLNKEQEHYRTRIRNGAKSKVQFAGHYTVPLFGCGSGCSQFYIVDSISGRVYDGLLIVEFPGWYLETLDGRPPERFEFHPESRLLKIAACPDERDCGYYDYLMVDGKGLELLDKELLSKKFQP
jgi:hypothetical protein